MTLNPQLSARETKKSIAVLVARAVRAACSTSAQRDI